MIEIDSGFSQTHKTLTMDLLLMLIKDMTRRPIPIAKTEADGASVDRDVVM